MAAAAVGLSNNHFPTWILVLTHTTCLWVSVNRSFGLQRVNLSLDCLLTCAKARPIYLKIFPILFHQGQTEANLNSPCSGLARTGRIAPSVEFWLRDRSLVLD